MSVEAFVDTNVFIYQLEGLDARKAEIPLDVGGTERYLDTVLAPLWRVMPATHLYERALGLQDRYRFSFYDALIVAAALGEGCQRLYSEDLRDGQQIDGLLIENPLRG